MKKKHIFLLLCFLWMLIIFLFSNQPADDSQGLSNTVIEILQNILHVDILHGEGWLLDIVSFIVRKAAHMSEYAILGILYVCVLRAYGVRHAWLFAFFGVVLYASTDEFHQLFIEGRSGQIKDVWIDTCGGLLGLIALRCYDEIHEKLKKRKHLKEQ